MDDLFRTKNETWRRIQSNLLFIAIVELLIYRLNKKGTYLS